MIEVSLYGAGGKPDWFMDLNPEGQVPVLTCFGGAKIFIDSEYILTRIADGVVEGGSKLMPDSDVNKEKMEEWRHDISNRVIPIGKLAVQKGGKNVDELMELLKEMDVKIKGPYLCGDAVTVADCAAFPFLWRINDEWPLTEENGCENIRKWLDKCTANPAFAKTIQGAWWWWW
uniref:GST C-terminal domain-containing protein n=2 Tax=Odontella aurita TaxID=265563 RepID=A0A7S4NGJ4_9STRA|mmetsp:Transcript_62822/g.185521  ORF Transcript_62822/g.185521 Transcript_62822/m.185521 type:complete len:174 (+) Transcript_62822:772-1293(+)